MNKTQQLMLARMGLYQSGQSDAGRPEQLEHFGGLPQHDRMVNDKYRSFQRALYYSYQRAFITPLGQEESVRALINPNKVKQDYDDKIVSVDYKYNLEPGTVFKWEDTQTYWLIYLQELTELAYFRGDIRRCKHTVNWKDEDGKVHSTYIAVRGPVETKINSIQKSGDSVDVPNHSLNILMPKNEFTQSYFKRYAKFYLQEDQSICWRVEGFDSISMPGIIEINAVEYYINENEDSEGIAGNLVISPIEEDVDTISPIKGEILIKPKISYIYTCEEAGAWSIVEKDVPVELTLLEDNSVKIKWMKTHSGMFTIKCGAVERVIVVESLF